MITPHNLHSNPSLMIRINTDNDRRATLRKLQIPTAVIFYSAVHTYRNLYVHVPPNRDNLKQWGKNLWAFRKKFTLPTTKPEPPKGQQAGVGWPSWGRFWISYVWRKQFSTKKEIPKPLFPRTTTNSFLDSIKSGRAKCFALHFDQFFLRSMFCRVILSSEFYRRSKS